MLPLTLELPKPMLPIDGEPFLGYLLRYVAAQGGKRVVLCVGYLGSVIRSFAGDGSRFGLEVRYVEDGPSPLGTAGAVKAALPELSDAFFVLFGDAYLPIDYALVERRFRESELEGLMTVYLDPHSYHPPNVEIAGGRVVAYDKKAPTAAMNYIDYGLSVYRASAFAEISPGIPADLSAVNARLIAGRQLAALEVGERFYEIGSPQGLAQTASYLRQGAAH
jgi:MurNAc alpha-1-phosphate uridylyltransferase